MHNSLLEKAKILNQKNTPYAIASVIRRVMPSSGKPGDKAIITNKGEIFGWIGGGCTRGIVLKEALLSIQDNKSRLISISPNDKEGSFSDYKTYTMTCQSGGEVDLYIEPILPKPQIVILGSSHIGVALSKIAKAMDYRVSIITSPENSNLFQDIDQVFTYKNVEPKTIGTKGYFVVCTQGQNDLEALQLAFSMPHSYISFVASLKKANSIYSSLRKSGISFDQLKTIKTPAGLDLNAKLPEEVAISIIAQIIQEFRNESAPKEEVTFNQDDYYMNPVCNIPIQKNGAKHILNYKDEKIYFCCDGCKVKFESEPELYMAK